MIHSICGKIIPKIQKELEYLAKFAENVKEDSFSAKIFRMDSVYMENCSFNHTDQFIQKLVGEPNSIINDIFLEYWDEDLENSVIYRVINGDDPTLIDEWVY